MTDPKPYSDEDHEYATTASVATVAKGLRIVSEHALKREFDSPCFIDWMIELPQQAHLLIRDGNGPVPMFASEGITDIDQLATMLEGCADELEGEIRLMHATNEVGASPALILFLVKAISVSKTLYQLLPEETKEKIRKYVPFL